MKLLFLGATAATLGNLVALLYAFALLILLFRSLVMNTLRLLALAVTFTLPAAALPVEPAPVDAARIEATLKQRREELIAGLLKGDLTAWESNTADDSVTIDGNGVVLDKNAAREILKAAKLESWQVDEIKARPYGDVIVTTTRNTIKGYLNGKNEDNSQFRVTTIMVNRNGKYVTVASHWSRIAKPSPLQAVHHSP